MRRAKIVCTLGPSSADEETIRELSSAGMTVARLNSSHASPSDAADLASRVRQVEQSSTGPLATLLDLRGPEVRTTATTSTVELIDDTTVRFVPDGHFESNQIGVTTSLAAASVGDRILVDDGRIETTVEAIDGDIVVARVDNGGHVGGRAGVNVPGVDLGLDPITPDDEPYLEVAATEPIDFVAASFVRSEADVVAVSEVLEKNGADLPVIAKIERRDAVDNLDAISQAASGVMVARGDLGVECSMEDVPMIQKQIIRRCRTAGTPVITATEMLDSMVEARRPTRAEASDVANAIFDGTDAVMLSGETAVGEHPVRVVEVMDRIVRRAESAQEYADLIETRVPDADGTSTEALARSARYLARDVDATAVIVASESGFTARKVAKFQPSVPTVAATPSEPVRRRLALLRGVTPVQASLGDSIDDVIAESVAATLEKGIAESGDTVVVVAGLFAGSNGPDTSNVLKVHVAATVIGRGRSVVGGRVVGPVCRLHSAPSGQLPEGCIVVLERDFDGTLDDGLDRIAGIVDAEPGLTGYGAMVARELEVPMVSDAVLDGSVADGDTVTIDGDRGVIYDGDVTEPAVGR